MVNSSIDWEHLTRYLSGQCSPDEALAFESWIATDPERQSLVDDMRAGWTITPAELDAPVDVRAGWRQVAIQIENPSQGTIAPRRGRIPAARRSFPWAPIVAMAAVFTGITWFTLASHPSSQPMREFATPAGGRATITLRDGTRLTLGPETYLRVPADFGVHTRSVELTGEAVFAVVHDALHPFVVHVQGTTVTDVGTEFDVRAYRDADVRVAVSHGEVLLGVAPLHPGDVADMSGTQITVTHSADLAPYFAWTQGHLAFDATPLRDVIRQLGRTFNLDITVADTTLSNERVTASFTDQPVDAILEDVAALVGGRYERSGRAVVIKRGTSAARNNKPRPQLFTSHQ